MSSSCVNPFCGSSFRPAPRRASHSVNHGNHKRSHIHKNRHLAAAKQRNSRLRTKCFYGPVYLVLHSAKAALKIESERACFKLCAEAKPLFRGLYAQQTWLPICLKEGRIGHTQHFFKKNNRIAQPYEYSINQILPCPETIANPPLSCRCHWGGEEESKWLHRFFKEQNQNTKAGSRLQHRLELRSWHFHFTSGHFTSVHRVCFLRKKSPGCSVSVKSVNP